MSSARLAHTPAHTLVPSDFSADPIAKLARSAPPADAPERLKSIMRHVAATVSVVTAGHEDRTGATVTSATALSVDPARMIVNINRTSSTYPVILRHGHFCVNILSAAQQEIADRFAGKGGLKGAERYEGAAWTTLASGAPVLLAALAAVDCEVEEIIERHSHGIIIGRVVALAETGGTPLLYRQGAYGGFVA